METAKLNKLLELFASKTNQKQSLDEGKSIGKNSQKFITEFQKFLRAQGYDSVSLTEIQNKLTKHFRTKGTGDKNNLQMNIEYPGEFLNKIGAGSGEKNASNNRTTANVLNKKKAAEILKAANVNKGKQSASQGNESANKNAGGKNGENTAKSSSTKYFAKSSSSTTNTNTSTNSKENGASNSAHNTQKTFSSIGVKANDTPSGVLMDSKGASVKSGMEKSSQGTDGKKVRHSTSGETSSKQESSSEKIKSSKSISKQNSLHTNSNSTQNEMHGTDPSQVDPGKQSVSQGESVKQSAANKDAKSQSSKKISGNNAITASNDFATNKTSSTTPQTNEAAANLTSNEAAKPGSSNQSINTQSAQNQSTKISPESSKQTISPPNVAAKSSTGEKSIFIKQINYLGSEIIDKATHASKNDTASFSKQGVKLNFEMQGKFANTNQNAVTVEKKKAQLKSSKNNTKNSSSSTNTKSSGDKSAAGAKTTVRSGSVTKNHLQLPQQKVTQQILENGNFTIKNVSNENKFNGFFSQNSVMSGHASSDSLASGSTGMPSSASGMEAPVTTFVRKQLPVQLTQMVQKQNFSQRSDGKQVWHKHRILLDEGKSLQVAMRKGEGLIQLQLSSGNSELSRIIQQHLSNLRQHLQQSLDIQIDLHLQQQGDGEAPSEESFNEEAGVRQRGSKNVEEIPAKESTENRSVTRYYGFNTNEWTA